MKVRLPGKMIKSNRSAPYDWKDSRRQTSPPGDEKVIGVDEIVSIYGYEFDRNDKKSSSA